MFDRIDTKAAIALLIFATLLAYANSLGNSFVWDDEIVLVENNFVKSWKNFHRLFDRSYLTKIPDIARLGKSDIGSGEFLYRPVSTLTYFLDFSVWKLNAFGFHLTNLLLHIANAVLLFFLLMLITGKRGISSLASLLFAIHPVNAESVDVIAFRPNLLCFLFLALSFILFIKYTKSGGKRRLYAYSLSLASFLLALFSKEAVIIFPLILLSYDYLIGKIPGNAFSYFKKRYSGYAAVLLFYLFIKFVAIGNVVEQLVAYPMKNFILNISTMIKVCAAYIQWLALPVNVHPTLPDDAGMISHSPFEPSVIFSAALISLILFIAIKARRKLPVISFAIAWFFISLIPVANILYPLTNYMAARYLYLPSAGFCLAAAALLAELPHMQFFGIRPATSRKISANTAMVLLIFYLIFTAIGNIGFKNNTVFWMEMAENYPRNALAHSALGGCFRKSGILDEAIREYGIALSLDPQYAKDYLNLGGALGDKGSYGAAVRCFEKAIELDSKSIDAYNGLGVTYARMERYDKAKEAWQRALRICPCNEEALENLQRLEQSKKI